MTAAEKEPTSVQGGELDELTLTRACRGESGASRAFFEHYHRVVLAYLWRMLSPHATLAQVEDLVQETFLRAFQALPRFSPAGAARPSSWLLTIATHLALNELRRQRRHPLALVDVEAIAVAADSRADEAAFRRSLGAVLAREIARLQPDHRAVFLLREYHDLSYEQIARALGVDLGTVKSRLTRARAALRQALGDFQ